jgi:hypothetical protein
MRTVDPRTHEAYLKGRFHLNQRIDGSRRAIDLLVPQLKANFGVTSIIEDPRAMPDQPLARPDACWGS